MEAILGAIFGVLATIVLGVLVRVPADVDRRDRQVADRDQQLEEWVVEHHRKLKQRFHELHEQAVAAGVDRGGTIPAGQVATRTLLLYDYRAELRSAHAFVLAIEAEERSAHRLWRRLRNHPFPELTTPVRSEPILGFWLQGTQGNALTWSIEDIIAEEGLADSIAVPV
jgi:hypothetical protein